MRSALVLVMFAWCGVLNAQDPNKRMDPEDWLSLPVVQEALSWAEDSEDRFALQLRTPRGWLNMPARSQGKWWVREGDLRLVLDEQGQNLSKSHNIGFNLGCYQFTTLQGRKMALGGRGFWESHAKCIEFMPSSGEWELVMSSEGPAHVNAHGCWLESNSNAIWCITEASKAAWDTEDSPVWSLDASKAEWTRRGVLNPKLNLYWGAAGGGANYELEDYVVWPRLHQTVLIRKSDMAVVIHPEWRKAMVTEWIRRKPKEHSVLVVQGATMLELMTLSEQEGERVRLRWDVQAAFDSLEALHGVQPLLVPDETLAMEEAPLTDQNASLPLPIWPWMLGLGLGSAGFWIGRKRAGIEASGPIDSVGRMKHKGMEAETTSIAAAEGQAMNSEDVQALEALGDVKWRTAEFNQYLHLGADLSEESKRARRAQFIRDVNREYQLKHSCDLISREKDPEDRRRTYYVIRPR